jgi:hypothetical protein
VGKLDRHSPNLVFIAGLIAQRVLFIVAELGEAQVPSCCTHTTICSLYVT